MRIHYSNAIHTVMHIVMQLHSNTVIQGSFVVSVGMQNKHNKDNLEVLDKTSTSRMIKHE